MIRELNPISYRIELYEDSFVNDPLISFESKDSFLNFNVGDYISHQSMSVEPHADMKDKVLRVKAIQHLLWEIAGSHIGHSLSVCVEAVPRPSDLW